MGDDAGATMILSHRNCRVCQCARWHELDFRGAGLPGWALAAAGPFLAAAAAIGGRWECGECGQIACEVGRPGGPAAE